MCGSVCILFIIVWPLDDNKVPGYPPDASASWKGWVLIFPSGMYRFCRAVGGSSDAFAEWKNGVLFFSRENRIRCMIEQEKISTFRLLRV